MANKKNIRKRNVSRAKFNVRKKIDLKKLKTIMPQIIKAKKILSEKTKAIQRKIRLPQSFKYSTHYTVKTNGAKLIITKTEPPCKIVEGYRIIDLKQLSSHEHDITLHVATCDKARGYTRSTGKSPVKFLGEQTRHGLASTISSVCLGCHKECILHSSKKIDSHDSSKRFEANVMAVWGQMSVGGGATSLNEGLATMGIPGITPYTFSLIESQVGSWWQGVLLEELKVAGAEERKLAIENSEYNEGVPAISVIVDGGWCKHTHEHSYNAMGGVAIIIGAHTKKLLFIGVWNKYCSICSHAEIQNVTPRDHVCFKNWRESSQAMEADIILEGFNEAERMHGVRYTKFIGDGDSSTYSTLVKKGPHWCRNLTKMECSNHACKCVRSNLEALISAKPHY